MRDYIERTRINPILYITPRVKLRMDYLIRLCNKEVGWHGLIEKVDNGIYIWYDILLYPQYVTGATVDPDQNEYAKWLDEQYAFDNGKSYNKMRLHGHSHVNMGVTPSGTDMKFRSDVILNLKPDDFYIFGIWNKKGDYSIELYDPAQNAIFDTKDITIIIADRQEAIKAQEWATKVIANNVKEKKWTSMQNQQNSSNQKDAAAYTSSELAQWAHRYRNYSYDWE